MSDETKDFLDKLEAEYGGRITWKTFSTWYGCSDSVLREFGVFLFKIGDRFYFEDFEKNSSIFGMQIGSSKKKKAQYIKLKRSIDSKNIKNVFKVTQAKALDVIKYGKDPSTLKETTLIEKIFRKSVTAVVLENGIHHFFELLSVDDFKKNI